MCDGQDKWTALHYASFNGHLEAIQTLIDHGANVDARDNDGATPCHYATDNCQNEAILLLAANGADVNMANNVCVMCE